MSIEIVYNNNADTDKFATELNNKLNQNGIEDVTRLKSENLNPDTVLGIITITVIGEITKMILLSLIKSIKDAMKETDEYTMKVEVKIGDKLYKGIAEIEEATDDIEE